MLQFILLQSPDIMVLMLWVDSSVYHVTSHYIRFNILVLSYVWNVLLTSCWNRWNIFCLCI